MKDNFSLQSAQYFQYRPDYPKDLLDFLFSTSLSKNTVWDCGTGNGQLAVKLSKHFEKVYATDLSENQIKNAVKKSNIVYKVEQAEKTNFDDKQFDLITVAQAIHWFDFKKFYEEVYRTLKDEGIFAAIGYNVLKVNPEIDKIIDNFYKNIVGPYWDKERRYVDEAYATIPFPFEEIKSPLIHSPHQWSFEQLIGYLNTWSSVQHYIKKNESNPVEIILNDLKDSWGKSAYLEIKFPLLLRIGKKAHYVGHF